MGGGFCWKAQIPAQMAGRYLSNALFGTRVEKFIRAGLSKTAALWAGSAIHTRIARGTTKVLLVSLILAAVSPATASLGSRQLNPPKRWPVVHESGDSILDMSLVRQRLRRARADEQSFLGDHGIVVTAEQLKGFLTRRASPMSAFTSEILSASNRYGVDPRLVVAIAGVESDFGKVCKGFNAWGWNNGRTRWQSWAHSIDVYTRSISERYPNWRNVAGMARNYNPNTPVAWARKVMGFMEAIGHSRI